ncbi:hypothetical protein SETIT_9G581100v2 [Setaria italica]|uniref:Uncharacterized protein n=1 Tax=Setaria italica TaxID=4555 RepID=A0A368SXB1_SETIT|nr:hypothetical protein SETIT_9G581100v2 [Setaria italica]
MVSCVTRVEESFNQFRAQDNNICSLTMDTYPDPATLAKAMGARKSVVTVLVEKK